MKQIVLLSLLAVLLPLVAWADVWQDPVYKVNYEYTPGSGEAGVKAGFFGAGSSVEGSVVIVDKFSVNGIEYVVTGIGQQAFLGQESLTSVTIPNTVKIIYNNAFAGCKGLTEIYFGNSVTSIELRAFNNCNSLTSIDLPNSLTYIGEHAFERCYNLKDVKLPNSLTTIDMYAFNECNLTSITIPKSVKCIKTSAFGCESLNEVHISDLAAWCRIEFTHETANPLNYAKHLYLNNKEITDVEIPEGTTCISDYAFYNFSGMTSIKIPKTVTSIGKETFRNCIGLTTVNIPNSVESIGEWAFGECSGLKYIIIGKGFKSIGGSAFSHCWVLSDVYCLAEKGPSAGGYVTNQAPDPLLHVPSASVESHKKAEWWGGSFRDVVPLEPGDPGYEDDDIITFADAKVKHICVTNWDTNGDGELSKTEAAAVTSIGGVFEGHDIKSFEEFQYFTGVTTLKGYAFAYCRELTKIILPNSIVRIESMAIFECDLLSSVVFPDNDGFSMGSFSIQACPSLTTITLPKNLKSVDSNPLVNCQNLKEIIVDASNPSYKSVDGVMYSKNGYSIISYPIGREQADYSILDGTRSIGELAFIGSYKLQNITIPNTVKYIGTYSFSGCNSIQSIDLPSVLETISYEAFQYCSSLKSVTIPSSVKSIGSYAYKYCSALESIKVESGNAVYDSRDNCNAIIETKTNKMVAGCKTTVIPNSVTSIADKAFNGHSSLTSITIPSSITSIGSEAFYDCTGLTEVRSLIEEPFVIYDDVFQFSKMIDDVGEILFTNATLYVPKGTKAKYQATDGWKNFSNIVEMGGESIEAAPYAVYNNGTLTFYCDNQRSNRQGTSYDLNKSSNKPGWNENVANITLAVFDNSFANARPTSTYEWFMDCELLAEIQGIHNLNTSKVTNMSGMFRDCKTLSVLDVTHFDTGLVTNMQSMFNNCNSLSSLDVSHFNTGKVTNMGGMFFRCFNLKNIDVSNFNTEKVTDMCGMFEQSGITQLDVSNFNTSNVTRIFDMFKGCKSLNSLDLSNFDTSKAISMGYMFYSCSSLTDLNISSFDTGNVTNMDYMFGSCKSLKRLDVSSFNTSKVTSMKNMFYSCSSLTQLDVSNFDTRNVTDMGSMFTFCKNVSNIVFGNLFTSNDDISVGTSVFTGCSSLNTVTFTGDIPSSINSKFFTGVGKADTPATLDVPEQYRSHYAAKFDGNQFFGGYFTLGGQVPIDGNITFADTNVKRICVANWDTNGDGELSMAEAAAVKDIGMLFYNNKKIKSFNELQYFTGLTAISQLAFLGNENMTSVVFPPSLTTIGKFAFASCTQLQKADLTKSVTSIGYQAFGGTSLTAVVIPSSLTYLDDGVYAMCNELRSISVESGNTVYDSRGNCNAVIQTATNKLVQGCSTTVIPQSVTAIGDYAFNGFDGIMAVNLPASVTAIGNYAYEECSKLTTITIPASVKSIGEYVFYNCTSLNEVHSKIKEPMAIDLSVFQTYSTVGGKKFTTATLYVPKGTKSKYQNTAGWKNFSKIVEEEDEKMGDANGDGVVDVADIAAVINIMAKGLSDKAADVNGDGVVDVADIAAIINIMAANARLQGGYEE